jgi:uncharacterized protein YwgA
MDRLKRAALLTKIVDYLRDQDSWCGETHIQKATYFLQELVKIPLEYEFILYKHGPFSFDLRDEITSLRADELFVLEPQNPPYGPRINTTAGSHKIQNKFPKTVAKYRDQIEFVAREVGNKGVAELERLATALFVTRMEEPYALPQKRAESLCRLKPHISSESGQDAVHEIDLMIKKAKKIN